MSSHKKVILKTLKELDTIWHPDSKLVFKSKEDKKVTGRYDNNEFIELDDEAIELCKLWKFKYDEDVYNKKSSSDAEEAVKQTEEETDEESSKEDIKEEVASIPGEKLDEKSTENLNEKASDSYEDVIKSFSGTFSSMFLKLSECNKDLEIQLENKSKEYSKLSDEYKTLSKKFSTIKDLFS